MPQVLFAIPCMQADPALMQSVHRPALEVALNVLGINRNYPQGVAYSGPEYFDLDLNDFAASQGVVQLEMYVGHCCRRDHTGNLLLIGKYYVELLIGKGQCPLEYPESTLVHREQKSPLFYKIW